MTIFKPHASYAILFFAKFFDKSQLSLVNYVCYILRYRVIYFQCLCYLALPLCIVSMHLTRCVSFFFPSSFFNLLFSKLQFMRIKMYTYYHMTYTCLCEGNPGGRLRRRGWGTRRRDNCKPVEGQWLMRCHICHSALPQSRNPPCSSAFMPPPRWIFYTHTLWPWTLSSICLFI